MYGLSAIMNLVGVSQSRQRSSSVRLLKVGSALFVCMSVAFGCFSELPTSVDGVTATGPVVNYDPQARPFPIAPFPPPATSVSLFLTSRVRTKLVALVGGGRSKDVGDDFLS